MIRKDAASSKNKPYFHDTPWKRKAEGVIQARKGGGNSRL